MNDFLHSFGAISGAVAALALGGLVWYVGGMVCDFLEWGAADARRRAAEAQLRRPFVCLELEACPNRSMVTIRGQREPNGPWVNLGGADLPKWLQRIDHN